MIKIELKKSAIDNKSIHFKRRIVEEEELILFQIHLNFPRFDHSLFSPSLILYGSL